jgi:hypothetical protein
VVLGLGLTGHPLFDVVEVKQYGYESVLAARHRVRLVLYRVKIVAAEEVGERIQDIRASHVDCL